MFGPIDVLRLVRFHLISVAIQAFLNEFIMLKHMSYHCICCRSRSKVMNLWILQLRYVGRYQRQSWSTFGPIEVSRLSRIQVKSISNLSFLNDLAMFKHPLRAVSRSKITSHGVSNVTIGLSSLLRGRNPFSTNLRRRQCVNTEFCSFQMSWSHFASRNSVVLQGTSRCRVESFEPIEFPDLVASKSYE